MLSTRKILSIFLFKKVVLIALFFTITPIALFASILSLLSISKTDRSAIKNQEQILASDSQKALVYAAAKKNIPSMTSEIVPGDARSQIISDYLKSQNSPLLPYSEKIIEAADKYNLDYRLLPAIAQKESGLCKRIPEGSHNCWGWGIHSKGTLMFDSYDEAIEIVSKGLRENYLDEGYVTPDQIMKKYAHPDSTTWANGVNVYMSEME